MIDFNLRPEHQPELMHVYIPYDRVLFARMQAVPSGKYNYQTKLWQMPDIPANRELLSQQEGVLILKNGSHQWVPMLMREMKIRCYSQRTSRSYVYYNIQLLEHCQKKPEQVNQNDIRLYLEDMVNRRKASASTLNCAVNALRFFYGQVLGAKFVYEVARAKKDKHLPVVLSKEEIKKLLEVTTNLKHRLLLSLAYSAGLRVSEVVNLKIRMIDFDRKTIRINGAKGRKDRITLLSNAVVSLISRYLTDYRPPSGFLKG